MIRVVKYYFKNLKRKFRTGFLKDLGMYLSAEIIVKALGLLSLPIITRLITPADFGIIKIYESLVMIFVIIFGLALPSAVKRKFYDNSPDFKKYSGTALNFIFLINIFFLAFVIFFRNRISNVLSLNESVVLYAWFAALFTVFYRFYTDYLQAAKLSGEYTIIKLTQGLATVFLSLALIYFLKENKFYGKMYADIFVALLIAFFILFRISKIYSISLNKKMLSDALKFSLPMIPALMSGFALSYFDQLIISDIKGNHETGLYSAAYQIGMIIYVIQISSSAAYQPYFFEAMNSGNLLPFIKIIKNYTKFLIFLSILLIIFYNEAALLFIGKNFRSSSPLIPVIVFSYIFYYLYTLYSNYFIYYKRTGTASLILLFSAGLNIVLNYIFIPRFGYSAAALTTLTAYTVQFFLFKVVAYFLFKRNNLLLKTAYIKREIFVAIFSFSTFIILYNFRLNVFLNLSVKIFLVILFGYFLFKDIFKHKTFKREKSQTIS